MAFEFNMASVDVLQASFCGMDITPCKFPATPASSIPPPPAFDEAVSPSAPPMPSFAPSSQSFFTPGAPAGKPKKKVLGTAKKIEDEFPKLSIHITSAPPPPSPAFPPAPSFGASSLQAPSFHAGTKESSSGRGTPRRARKSMEKGVTSAHTNNPNPYPSIGPKVQSFAFGPPPHPPPRANNNNNNNNNNINSGVSESLNVPPNVTNNIPQHNNNKRIPLTDLKKLIESVVKAERSASAAQLLALAAQSCAQKAQKNRE